MTTCILQTLRCLIKFVMYIIPCVIILLAVYKFCRVPKFVFRKLLHIIAFTCVTLMILVAESWAAAALAAITVMIAVYPVLSVLESKSWFSSLFVQKSPGEVKRSLLMLFGMFAVLTAVGWGIFHNPVIVAAAILMWGTGDAAAALIGIPYGRNKVKFADGKKSWEGTAAMFSAAVISGILVFCLLENTPLWCSLLLAVPAAAVGAFTELVSPGEYDTVTVPSAIIAVLIMLFMLVL